MQVNEILSENIPTLYNNELELIVMINSLKSISSTKAM